MDNQIKKKLVELLGKAEEHVAVMCGNVLSYIIEGEQIDNNDYNWDDYFDDIVSDSDFESETENMQLYIKLK